MSFLKFELGSRPGSVVCCFYLALCSLCLTKEAPAQDSAQSLASDNQQPTTLSITTREGYRAHICRLHRYRRRRIAALDAPG